MIAVTGATGFVGFHLLKAFEKRAKEVRCLVRPASPRRHRLNTSSAEVREVDFENAANLRGAFKGCDTVIHILGLINGTDALLRRVNIDYTRNVVEAARSEGAGRFIFVSSVAAIRRHGSYGETKFQAEELVRLSGLPYIIFRPAYIYGEGDTYNTGLLLRTLKTFPMIPLLGGGSFQLQPVYIDDMISLLMQSVDRPVPNKIYNVAGPRQIALREMLVILGSALKLKRFFIPIPLKPVQAVVRIYARIFKNTRLPAKQLLELDKHEAFDISQTSRDFVFKPIEFREGVGKMFGSCAA